MNPAEKPHETKMYGLHALDLNGLEGPKKPKQRFSELDLAKAQGNSPPVSKRAEIIEDLWTKAKAVVVPGFPSTAKYDTGTTIASIENATDAATVTENCEEMRNKIDGTILAFKNEVEYNSLHFVAGLAEFIARKAAADPSIDLKNKAHVLNIYYEYAPDSRNEADTRGTTCVGKAQALVNRLSNIGVTGYVVAETENEPNAPATHAAVVVPCSDGLLLIESEYPNDYIIQLKTKRPEGAEFTYPGPTDPTPLPHVKLSLTVVENPGNFRQTMPIIAKAITQIDQATNAPISVEYNAYVLNPINNPDRSIMKRWFLKEVRYPVSSQIKNNEQHIIKVNLIRSYVTFEIRKDGQEKKVRLPFDAILANTPQSIDWGRLQRDKEAEPIAVDDAFFGFFDTDKALLLNQLYAIKRSLEPLKLLFPKEETK